MFLESFKKNPFIYLLLFLQAVLSFYFVMFSVESDIVYNSSAEVTKSNYTDNTFVYNTFVKDIMTDTSGETMRKYLHFYETAFFWPRDDDPDYDEYWDNVTRMNKFLLYLRADGDLRKACCGSGMLFNMKYNEFTDSIYSALDSNSVIYDDYDNRLVVNAVTVNYDLLTVYDLKIAEGRNFTESDFNFSSTDGVYRCPVVLGNNYKGALNIGDKIPFSFYSDYVPGGDKNVRDSVYWECEVIGFLDVDQYLPIDQRSIGYTSSGRMNNLNNYVVFPIMDILYSECEDDRSVLHIFTKMMFAQLAIIIPNSQFSEKLPEIENYYYNECGFKTSPVYLHVGVNTGETLVSQINESILFSEIISVCMTVLALASVAMSVLYIISRNIKNYAIQLLNGASPGLITLTSVRDSLFVILLAYIAAIGLFYYYDIMHVYAVYPEVRRGFWVALAVVAAIVLLSAIISVIFARYKLSRYSLSTLIRGKDIQKNMKMPVYKVVFGASCALFAVYISLFVGYNYNFKMLDRYYNDYYSKYSYDVSASAGDYSKLKNIDLSVYGGDYTVSHVVNTAFNEERTPYIRGVYFNGVERPELITGRWYEEDSKDEAVVGKFVYDNMVSENENGEKILNYNGSKYKVVGVMGKSGATDIDKWMFISIPSSALSKGWGGVYVIDSDIEAETLRVTEAFCADMKERGAETSYGNHPNNFILPMRGGYFVLILIDLVLTLIIFNMYYVLSRRRSQAIATLTGISRTMRCADIFFDYLLIVAVSYAVSTLVLFIISLFNSSDSIMTYFSLSAYTVGISSGMLIAACVVFTVIAMIFAGKTDISEELRADQ